MRPHVRFGALRGQVTFIKSLDEKVQAVHCMMRQLDKNPEKLIAGLNPQRLEKLKSTTIGRIDIEFMTGKKSEKAPV